MGGTTIEVADWADLDGLVAAMGEVGEQMERTTSYAVAWVCRPDGFTTSPVCLLRPLAEVLEAVAEAFGAAGRTWYDDWRRIQEATAGAAEDLRVSDARADVRGGRVLGRLDRLDRLELLAKAA